MKDMKRMKLMKEGLYSVGFVSTRASRASPPTGGAAGDAEGPFESPS
jgi:hypothetical protein